MALVPAPSLTSLDELQKQIEQLQEELAMFQQRDDALRLYMDRFDQEMRLAARLQQDFLPKTLPTLGAVRFHAIFRPLGYVSGDIYDVSRLDEQHIGISVADAIGHGVPAALLTMFIRRALVSKEIGASGYRLLGPGEALARLNDALLEQDLSQLALATAVYATINWQTLELTFARGGHPCPILVRPREPLADLQCEGNLLGAFAAQNYEQRSVQLCPGDRVLFFSDGLEVAYSDDFAQGSTKWRREIDNRRDLPADQMLKSFVEDLDNEQGSLHPKDDLTLVMLEVLPAA